MFTIDVESTPTRIDIEFVDWPEAGNWSYGIFKFDRDSLVFCIAVVGSDRPTRFASAPGVAMRCNACSVRPVPGR